MKFNLKNALVLVFSIVILFSVIYLFVVNFPDEIKFGYGEIIFLALLMFALFLLYKCRIQMMQDLEARAKISKVIKNKKLLAEKMQNPELNLNGEVVKIGSIVDRGERLNVSEEEGEIKIAKEKIKIKKKKKERTKKKKKKAKKKKPKKSKKKKKVSNNHKDRN